MAGSGPAMTTFDSMQVGTALNRLPRLLPTLCRGGARANIVDIGELDAVADQPLVEIRLRHRRHVGNDRPAVAAVEALEHLAVGVDGVERVAILAGFDGQAAEQRALAVGQAAEQPLPGLAGIATPKDFSAGTAQLVPVHRPADAG